MATLAEQFKEALDLIRNDGGPLDRMVALLEDALCASPLVWASLVEDPLHVVVQLREERSASCARSAPRRASIGEGQSARTRTAIARRRGRWSCGGSKGARANHHGWMGRGARRPAGDATVARAGAPSTPRVPRLWSRSARGDGAVSPHRRW